MAQCNIFRTALTAAKDERAVAQSQLAETEAIPIVAMHPAIADIIENKSHR